MKRIVMLKSQCEAAFIVICCVMGCTVIGTVAVIIKWFAVK
jgi:hypothetical protein